MICGARRRDGIKKSITGGGRLEKSCRVIPESSQMDLLERRSFIFNGYGLERDIDNNYCSEDDDQGGRRGRDASSKTVVGR